jgi:ADP-heptose:LPS heptosyltransferase
VLPAHDVVPDVDRIAVLRANALGDFVFALPALDALRAAYPAAEIVLLGRAWHRELLAGRPAPVDRAVALPEGTVGDERVALAEADREAMLEALRRDRWDVAIQLHGGGANSNRIVRALGARVTAGAATPNAPPLDRVVAYVYWQHEVARWLEVVALVGAVPVTLQPSLAVVDDDLARSRAVIGDAEGPTIVLHPGATDPRRRWPPDRFGAVARELAADGFRVVVTGTDGERDLGRAVAEGSGGAVVDLVGRLDLRALVGLLARSALVVSNDTGPLHLADAVGARSVGIYWIGNAINGAPAFRARHRPLLSWRTDCPVCAASCLAGRCAHDASFVDGVTVTDVLDAAHALLGSADRVGERRLTAPTTHA